MHTEMEFLSASFQFQFQLKILNFRCVESKMPFFVPQAVPLTSCGTSNKVARGAGAGEAEVFLFTLSLSVSSIRGLTQFAMLSLALIGTINVMPVCNKHSLLSGPNTWGVFQILHGISC